MVHWQKSYEYGKQQEQKVLPILKEYFKREIQATPGQYSKYDFTDDLYNYECKSRTNRRATYPTTMITFNKLPSDADKPLILIFNFTDCLCFIEYKREKFALYETNMFSRLGLPFDEKPHAFIPIEDLTEIVKY
jgi:hypothetical protein